MRGLVGFAVGVIVGAIGALLFVPVIGEKFVIDTQAKIQEAFRKLEIDLLDIGQEVKEHVEKSLDNSQMPDWDGDASSDNEGADDGADDDSQEDAST